MKKALALARRGGRAVRPNPRVGAVVVKEGEVIAAGYHARFGGEHAEVSALRKAGARARGAALYVTLEPCSTAGKTPPCVDEIVRSGVCRVVIGCRDRNPANRARAARILGKRGIKVTVGVLEEECLRLNRDFFVWVTEGRPYAILKLAFSLDGKIATRAGRARWITSPPSRKYGHLLRSRADAVVVGVNTVIADDPLLTARMGYSNPGLKKVVLDSRGRIPMTARLLKGRAARDLMVVTTPAVFRRKMDRIEKRGAAWIKVPARKGRVSLKSLFRGLAREGMIRVLIEGGGEVAASALSENLVDEVHFFIAPIIVGGRAARPAVAGEGVRNIREAVRLTDVRVARSGPDIHVQGRVKGRV